ncbi:MAG: PP-loop family protein [Desulfovibrio sp.]|uniref:PP-loop family protein n=1 Tax=Desulfovibrio sp. TaxID=885 RepID=UPI002A372133|nr:PP-loop family protein [Desulfovibrio sp.]MDY0259711.1 PP-loop family protein [Desulfovibrio sp.]
MTHKHHATNAPGGAAVSTVKNAPATGLTDAAQVLPQVLARRLRAMPPLVVAFSGGIDSRFLSHAALLSGCDVLAVHVRGPHIPAGESAHALAWARRRGLPLLVVDFDPLSLPEVATNSHQRCYACKIGLLSAIGKALAQAGQQGRVLCDGSNADDLVAYRPGLRALQEADVMSPLAESGMDKAAIRAAARATGLDDPEQRARPCLLTRLAYGLAPDADVLARLAAAEEALSGLADLEAPRFSEKAPTAAACSTCAPGAAHGESVAGHGADAEKTVSPLGDLRLRLTPAPVLQVEALPPELAGRVQEILVQHGFTGCELCVGQSISGYFDREALSLE